MIQHNAIRRIPRYTSWAIYKSWFAMEKECTPTLAKIVLIPLGLIAATAAADAGIYKKILGSGTYDSGTTTLIISNKEMEDIMKIVKSLGDSGLLVKCVTKTVKK